LVSASYSPNNETTTLDAEDCSNLVISGVPVLWSVPASNSPYNEKTTLHAEDCSNLDFGWRQNFAAKGPATEDTPLEAGKKKRPPLKKS